MTPTQIQLNKNLHILAQDLSGDVYGRCISYTDAIIKIKKEAIK